MTILKGKFPNKIIITPHLQKEKFLYTKMYEHDKNGCYYQTKENDNPVTSSFVSLYPDGRLTFLWNGKEQEFKADWKEVNINGK